MYALDSLELGGNHLHEGRQRLVHDDKLGLGVVDHVRQIRGGQTQVHQEHHGPVAGDGKVHLVITKRVPVHDADPVTDLDTQPFQDVAETHDALIRIVVGVAGHLIAYLTDDLLFLEVASPVLDEVDEIELVAILHRGRKALDDLHNALLKKTWDYG